MAFELLLVLRHFLTLQSSRGVALALIPFILALSRVLTKKPRRYNKVSKSQERVLVVGASSGIGRSVARQYASRGARVCIVGRREALLQEVVTECRDARTSAGFPTESSDIFSVAADFASPDDMVRVRNTIEAGTYNVHLRLSEGTFLT